MTDAKRTPYRDKAAPARPPAEPRPRGPVVTRAPEPEPEDAARRRTLGHPRRSGEPPGDPDAGVFSGLVAPHPASSPREWWAQAALTAIGLPLVASTFVLVGWLDTRRAYGEVVQRGHEAPRPLGIAHPAAWLLGAVPLAVAGFASGAHWALVVAGLGVPFVALGARRALRGRIVEREALKAALRRATE